MTPPRPPQRLGAIAFDATDSLDAAWSDAQAALPEGWIVRLEGGLDHAYASAFDGWHTAPTFARGDTPTAALRALAAKLAAATTAATAPTPEHDAPHE